MAQLIRVPNGLGGDLKWALWSSVDDDFVTFFKDIDDVIQYHCAKAYEAERTRVLKIMEQLEAGEKPYKQFTLTWGEANERAYRAHPDEYEFLHKDDL